MSEDELRAAVAAGVLGVERGASARCSSRSSRWRGRSSARTASSILLLDEETDELVFEAVAGEGAGALIGHALPVRAPGIAGWVLVDAPAARRSTTCSNDPRFAKDVAESTGYVPQGLMAVPLLARRAGARRARGARPAAAVARSRSQEMELLGLFANQAAIALDLLSRARQARSRARAGNGRARRRRAARGCRHGSRGRPARGGHPPARRPRGDARGDESIALTRPRAFRGCRRRSARASQARDPSPRRARRCS